MKIDRQQINRLEKALGDKAKRLPQEIAIAINATAKKTKTNMSRQVRGELTLPAKSINQTLAVTRKASKQSLSGQVRLSKTKRIPLRDYKARQTKKGVSYKISKSGPRKTIASAFQGPRPGKINPSWNGRVFIRKGKSRLPITQKFGPSPWGSYVKKRMKPETKRATKLELRKQVEKRIRFRILKSRGVI